MRHIDIIYSYAFIVHYIREAFHDKHSLSEKGRRQIRNTTLSNWSSETYEEAKEKSINCVV